MLPLYLKAANSNIMDDTILGDSDWWIDTENSSCMSFVNSVNEVAFLRHSFIIS